MTEESQQSQQRREKLTALRKKGNPFPNDFRRDAFIRDLLDKFADDVQGLQDRTIRVKVAGRLMSRRVMGKASFAHIEDVGGRMQLFLQRDNLPENVYNEEFKKYGHRRHCCCRRGIVPYQNR